MIAASNPSQVVWARLTRNQAPGDREPPACGGGHHLPAHRLPRRILGTELQRPHRQHRKGMASVSDPRRGTERCLRRGDRLHTQPPQMELRPALPAHHEQIDSSSRWESTTASIPGRPSMAAFKSRWYPSRTTRRPLCKNGCRPGTATIVDTVKSGTAAGAGLLVGAARAELHPEQDADDYQHQGREQDVRGEAEDAHGDDGDEDKGNDPEHCDRSPFVSAGLWLGLA